MDVEELEVYLVVDKNLVSKQKISTQLTALWFSG
jgi:hypothetical protein